MIKFYLMNSSFLYLILALSLCASVFGDPRSPLDLNQRNVITQRGPTLRNTQFAGRPSDPRKTPLSDQMRQLRNYQQPIISTGQNQRQQSQAPVIQEQQNVAINRNLARPQYKQNTGSYYEHNKSTDHVKAYNFDNIIDHDEQWPASAYERDSPNQQDDEPALQEDASMYNNYEEPTYPEQMQQNQYSQYNSMSEPHSQAYDNINPAEYQQQQYIDQQQTYQDLPTSHNHSFNDENDDLEAGISNQYQSTSDDDTDDSSNDDDNDEDDTKTKDYMRQLESELQRLKTERLMKKKQTKSKPTTTDPLVTGSTNLNREQELAEDDNQFDGSVMQSAIMPMSTNIAIYNNSPMGGFSGLPQSSASYATNGYYQLQPQQDNDSNDQQQDDDDIVEDEDDKFITSASGKLRPRFVDPVRLGYLEEQDDDDVDASKVGYVAANNNLDRSLFQQQQQQQQRQQQQRQQWPQQRSQQPIKTQQAGYKSSGTTGASATATAARLGPSVSASSGVVQQPPSKRESASRMAQQPLQQQQQQQSFQLNGMRGQPIMSSRSISAAQPMRQQMRRFKRSLDTENRDIGEGSDDSELSGHRVAKKEKSISGGGKNEQQRHQSNMKTSFDDTKVVEILRRVKRCGGGGGDDDDDGDANSVRRGRRGRRVNKTVKQTKKVKSGNKKKKKKNSKKSKTVKKVVTTKVIKNGQVQSVTTNEHPSHDATTNQSSTMIVAQQSPTNGGGCNQNQQSPTTTELHHQQQQQVPLVSQAMPQQQLAQLPLGLSPQAGQTIFVQTTPGKQVHTTSQTSQVSFQAPVNTTPIQATNAQQLMQQPPMQQQPVHQPQAPVQQPQQQ